MSGPMSEGSRNGGEKGRETPRDYDAMQREIRERQARIGDTIQVLKRKTARLAPRHLMEQTMNRMHTTTGGYGERAQDRYYEPIRNQSHQRSHSVGETMRSNPIPLAMIGIGLGWLALTASGYDRRIARSGAMHNVRDRAGSAAQYARDTFYSAGGTVREAASHAYERASDAASHVYERASDAVDEAGDRVRGLTDQARDRAHDMRRDMSSRVDSHIGNHGGNHGGASHFRASDRLHSATGRFWEMVDDHPMVAGIMGVALGAALGASIPSSRYEDRWVGDYADEATSRAKEMALDAMDRGTRAARAAVEAAKEEVGDAVSAASDAAREEARKPG
ncbi:hypothetical protein GAY33_06635 [Azospirillum brasilense]|uniref:DUF3618 domain-containing protein n=2 Tax=Azospirillum argentinense TaxID=2970906 RepID=A0A2K1G6B7_9PROT|nr:hypothetical protein [Azospirillum argentinense]PNR00317.1 hypothetical protein C1S70_02610 [Azospirillum argentinense]